MTNGFGSSDRVFTFGPKSFYSQYLLTLGSEVFAGDSGPHPGYVLLILLVSWSVGQLVRFWEERTRLDRLRAPCRFVR